MSPPTHGAFDDVAFLPQTAAVRLVLAARREQREDPVQQHDRYQVAETVASIPHQRLRLHMDRPRLAVQSEKFVAAHGGKLTDLSIFGQESNPTTWRLCKMNLAIRGIECNLGPLRAAGHDHLGA